MSAQKSGGSGKVTEMTRLKTGLLVGGAIAATLGMTADAIAALDLSAIGPRQSATPGDLAPVAIATPPAPALLSQRVGVDYRIPALQKDFTGSLWIGTWRGEIARINPETGQLQARVPLPDRTVQALAQDRVGRIWAGTYSGLVRVDPRTNQVTATNFSLPSSQVLSLQIDTRGFFVGGY